MRANKQTDERVAQYLHHDSCLFQTTVRRIVSLKRSETGMERRVFMEAEVAKVRQEDIRPDKKEQRWNGGAEEW